MHKTHFTAKKRRTASVSGGKAPFHTPNPNKGNPGRKPHSCTTCKSKKTHCQYEFSTGPCDRCARFDLECVRGGQ